MVVYSNSSELGYETATVSFVPENQLTENSTQSSDATQMGTESVILLVSMTLAIAVRIVTLTFGIASWAILTKWRTFRNFVFINVCLSGTFSVCLPPLFYVILNVTVGLLIMVFSVCSFAFWLLLTSITFYMDVVKIFNNNYDHIYLKAGVFAYGLPLVEILFDYFFGTELIELTAIGICVASIGLYLRVLFTLLQPVKIRGSFQIAMCQKIRIATIIFLMSGCAMVLPVHLASAVGTDEVFLSVVVLLFFLQISLTNVLFLMMPSHRTLWTEYLEQRRLRNNYDG